MARILLIHGAYQGGWIWSRVAAHLRASGHEVLAPSLDGCGERAHAVRPGITTESQAAELAGLLFHEDWRDTVAVGTSTGGMVLCRLAELAPERIGRLVFADALALRDGEALPDIVARPTAVNTDLTSGPSRADAEGRLCAELDPETRAWTLERITQHPIAPMVAPVVLPRFWSMDWKSAPPDSDLRGMRPSGHRTDAGPPDSGLRGMRPSGHRTAVIWCRRSQNPPVAHQRRLAEALGAAWHELDTGHYPMLSEPEALARLIVAG